MTQRWKFIWLVALFILSLAPLQAVFSQDDDARDIVLQAMTNLADGYHYTLDWSLAQHFIGEDDDGFATYTMQSVTGDVTADGDYHVTMAIRAGETPESLADSPTVELEQVRLGDDLYLYLPDLNSLLDSGFDGLEPGWHRIDDLLANFEELSAEYIVVQNLSNIVLPADFPLTDDLIVSVTEQESATIDGVDLRVFAIEVDALTVLVNQTPAAPEDQLRLLRESPKFFAKSELSLTYTLWIGADDSLLYHGESVGRNFLPYLTEEAPGPPYDMELNSMAAFTISQHGAVAAIELPDGAVSR